MKSLLILAPPIPPNHLGGDGKFALDIARELSKQKVKTVIFSPVYNNKYEDGVEENGLRSIKIPIIENKYKDNWDFPIWHPEYVKKRDSILMRALKDLNLLKNNFWIHEIGGSIFNKILSELRNRGFRYSSHIQFVLENYDMLVPNNRALKKLSVVSQRCLIENASIAFFLSRLDYMPYKNVVKKYALVPNGLNLLSYRKRKVKKNKKFSMFIGGRLYDLTKGAKIIFPILNNVIEKNDVLLNICAPDKEYFYLFDLEILPKVRYFGWLSVNKTQEVLASSHISLVPSLYEPFGLMAIESLANNVPVLGTAVGGLKDIIIEGINGYYIDLTKPKNIEKLLTRLIKNPKIVSDLSSNSWVNLERYDITNVAKLYIKHLRAYLNSH